MTECYDQYGDWQSFGYKRNVKGKNYLGEFDVREEDDRFEIWSLKIFERYQRKGYATKMLTEFLSQFKSSKPIVLYVYKINEVAIHLYEKVGFKIIGECSFEPRAYTMQYKGVSAENVH